MDRIHCGTGGMTKGCIEIARVAGIETVELLREDSRNREQPVVDRDGMADRILRRTQRIGPKTVRENYHRRRSGSVVGVGEQAALKRMHSQQREKIARHAALFPNHWPARTATAA